MERSESSMSASRRFSEEWSAQIRWPPTHTSGWQRRSAAAAFVRDRARLGRAFTLEPAEYLEGSTASGGADSPFDDFGELYHDFNVEQSAQSRGVTVWAILTEIGRTGLHDRIRRHIDFAKHLEGRVQADPRLELVAAATLSICCFRYRGRDEASANVLNARIAKRLRGETRFVPSTTTVAGRYAIRPCYINPRTTLADVDGLVDAVVRIGDDEVRGAGVSAAIL
jgi:aromatic-L-amino-acid decarboxylase